MLNEEFQRACRLGDTGHLRMILAKDPAFVNTVDCKLGWAPVFRTVICGHIEATDLLLAHGADPNVKNTLGETPLHQAADNNQVEIVSVLVQFNADTNARQNDGDTPLHHAAFKGHKDTVELLLQNGADPNLQTFLLGKSPLHYAAHNGHANVIDLLLAYKASAYVKDANGRCPGDYAELPELTKLFPQDSLRCLTEDSNEGAPQLKSAYESMIEPEGEKVNFSLLSFCEEAAGSSLHKWLRASRLGGLFTILSANGFDDLEIMVEQMGNHASLTEEMLKQIGVAKPGHRKRLLMALEDEYIRTSSSIAATSHCAEHSGAALPIHHSLDVWLNSMKLGHLRQNFYNSGYDDLEHLVLLMRSKWPINDEVLRDEVRIDKLGHRQRLLTRLQEEVNTGNRYKSLELTVKDNKWNACGYCYVM